MSYYGKAISGYSCVESHNRAALRYIPHRPSGEAYKEGWKERTRVFGVPSKLSAGVPSVVIVDCYSCFLIYCVAYGYFIDYSILIS